ncbi:unnamed protein product [Anisakis simplex]|uniref:Uncharacterized protein n=1 Tax=Anisakis simplex TaxID=6269 RepID=A0A3P6SI71_ANISI|nr:unnamed protein product [Anisakis simplex]
MKQWSSPSSRIIGNLFTPTITTAASSSSSYGLGNAELTNESLAVEAMRSLWNMVSDLAQMHICHHLIISDCADKHSDLKVAHSGVCVKTEEAIRPT